MSEHPYQARPKTRTNQVWAHPTVRSSVSAVVVGFWFLAGLLGGCGGKGLSRRGTGGAVTSGGLSESARGSGSEGGAATGDASGSLGVGGSAGAGGAPASGGAADANPAFDAQCCEVLAPDASTARLDSALDSFACSPPSKGAACTPEQTPCATCCIDIWSCVGGVWKVQFIGCLPTGFACGDRYCTDTAEYCLHIPGRGGELPVQESYSCERLPAPCYGQRCPTCDCLKQAGVPFQTCTSNAVGAISVVNQPY